MSKPTDSFAERRRIREQLQRSEAQGVSLDVGVKCKCPDCGMIHYKRPEPKTEQKSG